MFTGIIEAKARVETSARRGQNLRIVVAKPQGWKLKEGQSIAVDGICTTVISSKSGSFSLDCMPETLSKTTANEFRKGKILNLERSLRLDQFVDGHLTQGHVDARVIVHDVERKDGKHLISISVPKSLMRYVALHGSLTLNGVSLTVARLKKNIATVALIPHTLLHTNLGAIKKGDCVNLEVDLIARYVIHGKRVVE
jgi:riboflavin synthase